MRLLAGVVGPWSSILGGSCLAQRRRESATAPQHQLQFMCHIPPVRHFSFEERQLHFLLLIHITQVFETERKQTSLVNLPLIRTQSPLLLVTFLLGSPANLTGFYNRSDLLPCGWKECASFGGQPGQVLVAGGAISKAFLEYQAHHKQSASPH